MVHSVSRRDFICTVSYIYSFYTFSGKGRFGKLTISYPIDRGGSHNLHSNSNDGNSNDSGVGIDLHSSESHSQNSQWSWCSEDSYLGSFPISNVSIPQFPRSERSSVSAFMISSLISYRI